MKIKTITAAIMTLLHSQSSLAANSEMHPNASHLGVTTPNEISLVAHSNQQLTYLEISNHGKQKLTLALEVPHNKHIWQVTFPRQLFIPANTTVQFPLSLHIADLEAFKKADFSAHIFAEQQLLKAIPFRVSQH